MARRQRHPNEPRAVVAAATRITLKDRKLVKKQAARRQAWQEDAWEYFDLVGFVKQALWLLGNSIAKCRLFVAVENPEDKDGEPIPASDPASGVPEAVWKQAQFELDRLKGPVGGLSEILRELDMNLEVAGEGYLIGIGARPEVVDERTQEVLKEATPESWTVRSTSEVDVSGNGEMRVADEPGQSATSRTKLDPELDTAIRFWLRHPRWSNLPDSAMRGELEDLETLLILSRQRRAEGKSRLPSGLLLVASDVTAISPERTEQNDGSSVSSGDAVLDTIGDAISDAIEDESAAAGLAPVMLRVPVGPNESVKNKVDKLDLSRTSDQWLDNRIDALVMSVARGINLPVESVMGHQQTTFANADQVSEDKFYDHIEPRLLLIVDLITSAFIRPQLLADDVNGVAAPADMIEWAPRLFTWYDPSALLSKPDPSENADAAIEHDAISDAAYRAAKGFGEDDAPTPEERLIRAALKGTRVPPDVYAAIIELLGVQLDITALPSDQSSNGQASTPMQVLASYVLGSGHVEAIATTSRPEPPTRRALSRDARATVGLRLMELDRELRSRLLTAASTAMDRALERAGNRAKQRLPEAKALVRRVDAAQVLRTLGPSIVAAGGVTDDELLDGAFDELESTFMRLGARSQKQALDLASELGTGFTTEQRDAYQLRQAEDLTEGWAWLKEQLVTLAQVRMYAPAADAPPVGEFDPSLSVPASMIRQSMTRAGGTIGVHTSGSGDAFVSLADAGDRPAGGIGTGELIREAIGTNGGQVEGYEWVYGPAMREHPFEDHLELDGLTFINFDDDQLDASASWVPFDFFFPGDHDGCLCDFVPIIIDSSDEA